MPPENNGPSLVIDDPGMPDPQPQPSPNGRTFTEEQMNLARQQEKEKLYNRLTEHAAEAAAAKAELETLRAERQAQLDATERQRQEAESAQQRQAEQELSAKELLDIRTRELTEQLAQINRERAEERALFDREREFNELREYAQSQIRAHGDDIAPELLDLINGNSFEEIDESIALMKAKSASIVSSMFAAQESAMAAQPRGVAPTGRPDYGLMENSPGTRSYSPQDIKNMSIAEYARVRSQLLEAANTQVRTRGLYG